MVVLFYPFLLPHCYLGKSMSGSYYCNVHISNHMCLFLVGRPTDSSKNVSQQNSKVEEFWDELNQEEDCLYGSSPPRTPRQMKRMSSKHLRASQNRAVGRSSLKGKMFLISSNFFAEMSHKFFLTQIIGSTSLYYT